MTSSGSVGFMSHMPLPLNQEKLWVKTLRYFLTQIGVPATKSANCNHKGGCIDSCLCKGIRIAVNACLIKALASIVFKLKFLFKNPKSILRVAFSKDNLRFTAFIGLLVMIYKAVACSIRWTANDLAGDYLPLLAGAVAGLISIQALQKQTKQSVALFLFVRALQMQYNALVKKGTIKEIPYFYVVLYSVMMGLTGWAYMSDLTSLSSETNRFYLQFTNESLPDMQMREIFSRRVNNTLDPTGFSSKNPVDFIPQLKRYYALQDKTGLAKSCK